MRSSAPFLLFSAAMFFGASCSGFLSGYKDTRVEDSIAEAQTRDKTPRTTVYKGAEAKRFGDSVLNALMKLGNVDSATLFSTPEGYARVIDSGFTYLKKLTPEEIEENERRFNRDGSASGDIIAYDLDGKRVGRAGYREQGKPYVINTEGLPPGTYMLSIPGEKQMKKIVVQ